MQTLDTDILILGAGGAGLFAALHAKKTRPDLDVTIAVKGLLGKCGCTRMVQGGYNVALASGDSAERHFMDTIEGGKWLNEQDLAWTLAARQIDLHGGRQVAIFPAQIDGDVSRSRNGGQQRGKPAGSESRHHPSGLSGVGCSCRRVGPSVRSFTPRSAWPLTSGASRTTFC